MPTSVSALTAFQTVSSSLPEWLTSLETLSRQVSDRHAEFTRLSQTSPFTSMRRKKNNSTESLRPNDEEHQRDEVDDVHIESPTTQDMAPPPFPAAVPLSPPDEPTTLNPASPAPLGPNGRSNQHPFQATLDRETAALAAQHNLRRKRKSASLSSTHNAFAPSLNNPHHRSRARMSLIVYYDSAIQEGFQILVRGIASARNTLRKGRTAASLRSRKAGQGSYEAGNEGLKAWRAQKEAARRANGNENRNGNDHGVVHGGGGREGMARPDRFDIVDKVLEEAQSLCEIGAHSFLRDGNCLEEIKDARERFETCSKIVQEEVVILEEEEKREKEREEEKEREKASKREMEREREEREKKERAQNEQVEKGEVDENGQIDMEFVDLTNGDGTMEVDDSAVEKIAAGPGTIEVDDESDASSVHINLSAFRSTRRV